MSLAVVVVVVQCSQRSDANNMKQFDGASRVWFGFSTHPPENQSVIPQLFWLTRAMAPRWERPKDSSFSFVVVVVGCDNEYMNEGLHRFLFEQLTNARKYPYVSTPTKRLSQGT